MSWTSRLHGLAGFSAPDIHWRDVWVIIARGERAKGRDWAQGLLWSLKRHAWIIALDNESTTCRACGGKIQATHALARYCSTACRKVAFRRRDKGTPTDWQQTVAEANEALAAWRREVGLAQRAMRRWQRTGPPLIMPPDLTRYDHLPVLPERCQTICGGACPHTDGGACLYAATVDPENHFSDDDEYEVPIVR